ncbi:MAG: hypothetical protein AB7N76_01880 [Planctomycetota bacterium]
MAASLLSCPACGAGARRPDDAADPGRCAVCNGPLPRRGGVEAHFVSGSCFSRPAPLGGRLARELAWLTATLAPWRCSP